VTRSFDRVAGAAAILTAVTALGYAVAFIVLASVCLLVEGVSATPVWTAVYQRLRRTDPGFAGWALLLTLTGALGAAVHGGDDLVTLLTPTAIAPDPALPNPVDPRGMLSFAVFGLGILVLGLLITRNPRSHGFPRGVGYLAALTGIALLVLYLTRLTIGDPAHPLVGVPAALTGFLLTPALYAWLGVTLLRAGPQHPPPERPA